MTCCRSEERESKLKIVCGNICTWICENKWETPDYTLLRSAIKETGKPEAPSCHSSTVKFCDIVSYLEDIVCSLINVQRLFLLNYRKTTHPMALWLGNAAFCNVVLLPVTCFVHWLDLPGTFCVVQSAVLWTISFYAICWAWHGLPGTWLWEPTDGGSVSLGTTGTNLAFLKKPQVQNPTSSSTGNNFLVESFSIISSAGYQQVVADMTLKKRIMWKFARFCLRPHCRLSSL